MIAAADSMPFPSRAHVLGFGRWLTGHTRLLVLPGALLGLGLSLAPSRASEPTKASRHPSEMSVREIEQEIATTEARLAELPRRQVGSSGRTLGYASFVERDEHPDSDKWLAVDLGESVAIDTIALAPSIMVAADRQESTYGFPVRFLVEVAEDESFDKAIVVASWKDEPCPDPRLLPLVIDAGGVKGRWVRVRVFEMALNRIGANAFFGLGEILVFSGGRNYALGQPVLVADDLRGGGDAHWDPTFAVDGFTALGQPKHGHQRSNSSFSTGWLDDPEAEVDLVVDLGASYPIHELRLYPTHSRQNFAGLTNLGFGFPGRLLIEVSDRPDFEHAAVVFDAWEEAFPNPGDNTVFLNTRGAAGRYVRLRASDHFRDIDSGRYLFALAEFEIISDEGNVAAGRPVTSSHPHRNGWETQELVDGQTFNSEILPLEDWITGLAERRALQDRLNLLDDVLGEKVERQTALLRASLIAIAVVLALVLAATLRSRHLRQVQIRELQEQIAGDLHDEIGSNLGTIALLSDRLSRRTTGEEEVGLVQEIARVARESSQTMRDIVWLVGPNAQDADVVSRLRETANRLLEGTELEFELDPELARVPLDLQQRRNLLLFFKEALHNILRHARASRVSIHLLRIDTPEQLLLKVSDDGIGFTPSGEEQLEKLRWRARRLGADLDVMSRPGEGTHLELTLPLR